MIINLCVDCNLLYYAPIEVLLLVAKIAAISPSLHTLSAFGYGLGDNAVAFAEAISASTSLQTLDVSNNEIGANAPEFAAAISASLSLLTLNVSRNKISVNAPEFAAAISASPSLQTLDISYNNIGAAAPEFAAAISKLQSLHSLKISDNDINTYAPELIKLLDKLPSLHTLSFSECDNITDEEKSSIQEKLSANIQKYVDLVNKIETNGQELSTADLVFLSQCDKEKLKESLPENGESLIANSSAMQLIDTHMLELLGLCHHVPEEDSASQGMMVFSTILNSGYLSLYEMQQIAGDEIITPIIGDEVNIADDLAL